NAVHRDSLIRYADSKVKWGNFISAINDKLKKIGVDEDRLIGPYFIKPSEVTSSRAVDKLLLYLWDDVLRHRREQFFAGDIFTFSDLSENFVTNDVLNIASGLIRDVSEVQNGPVEDEHESIEDDN